VTPAVKVTWVKQEVKLGRKKIDGWLAQIPEREDRFLLWGFASKGFDFLSLRG
jgi:hypothetical protein